MTDETNSEKASVECYMQEAASPPEYIRHAPRLPWIRILTPKTKSELEVRLAAHILEGWKVVETGERGGGLWMLLAKGAAAYDFRPVRAK